MGLMGRIVVHAFERRLRRLYRLAADPGPVQERVLADLVDRARDTEWGRTHRYDGIRSVADFQARVAPATFDEVRPFWERMEAGECDVTWPGRTRYFAISAGTTSGSKHVPVSAEAIRANQRAGRDVVALCYRQMGLKDLDGGTFMYLGSSTTLRQSEMTSPTPRRGRGGKPSLVGDASGIMNAHIPLLVRRYHLPAPDIAAIRDWEEKIERICQAYASTPVLAVAGLPSWVVPLFERLIAVGRERLGPHVRTVADVWPHLQALVSFGMALDPYRSILEALVGRPICYVNTYSSSEGGMTAVQDRQTPFGGSSLSAANGAAGNGLDSRGMLVVPDNDVFYEFVPLDEADAPRPRRLALAEVEVGVPYEALISTNAGIWAYRLGDVVRFVTLRPHRLVMAGRTRHRLNAFGEHVIAEELEAALLGACEATGAEVLNFTVQAVFSEPNPCGTPAPGCDSPAPEGGGATLEGGGAAVGAGRHRWYVEFRRRPADTDAFMATADGHLKALNEDYASYRKGDVAVGPPELVPLARGTFYEWMKRSGRLGGQFKIPRVLIDASQGDRLTAISSELASRVSSDE